MMAAQKEVKQLLRAAERDGCTYEYRTGAGHDWVKAPDGNGSCFVASTPHRAGLRADRQKIKR
jgi:hypothetical protein